jgi:hypothetical protein
LTTIAPYFGDTLQLALTAASVVLMAIAINAYRKRPEPRYLLLMVAFTLLCITAAATVYLEFFTGLGPATVQLMELYLIPSLELLMAVSFLMALLWSSKIRRRTAIGCLTAALAIALVASAFYFDGAGAPSSGSSPTTLPAGCTKPPGGFLIVASATGYNDSIGHGAPEKSWPVLDMPVGSNVTITICNTYSQPVGFQVVHYLQNSIEKVEPGQVITVSFLAVEAGSFEIYCAIFCPIHVYLQSGEVNIQ